MENMKNMEKIKNIIKKMNEYINKNKKNILDKISIINIGQKIDENKKKLYVVITLILILSISYLLIFEYLLPKKYYSNSKIIFNENTSLKVNLEKKSVLDIYTGNLNDIVNTRNKEYTVDISKLKLITKPIIYTNNELENFKSTNVNANVKSPKLNLKYDEQNLVLKNLENKIESLDLKLKNTLENSNEKLEVEYKYYAKQYNNILSIGIIYLENKMEVDSYFLNYDLEKNVEVKFDEVLNYMNLNKGILKKGINLELNKNSEKELIKKLDYTKFLINEKGDIYLIINNNIYIELKNV